jgi:outer membrane murein-binding lipoprotein Lpp
VRDTVQTLRETFRCVVMGASRAPAAMAVRQRVRVAVVGALTHTLGRSGAARRPGDRTASPRRRWRQGAGTPPARWVRLCTGWTGPNFVAAQRCGLRQFSPPPADAALAEELVMHRVREKVQSELRQDRTELFNKIDSAVESLGPHFDAMKTKIEAVNTKIEAVNETVSTKIEAVNEAVSTKMEAVNTKIEAMNTKIDGTKSDISFQAAAYGLGGATLVLSALNFFGKSVAVVEKT